MQRADIGLCKKSCEQKKRNGSRLECSEHKRSVKFDELARRHGRFFSRLSQRFIRDILSDSGSWEKPVICDRRLFLGEMLCTLQKSSK